MTHQDQKLVYFVPPRIAHALINPLSGFVTSLDGIAQVRQLMVKVSVARSPSFSFFTFQMFLL